MSSTRLAVVLVLVVIISAVHAASYLNAALPKKKAPVITDSRGSGGSTETVAVVGTGKMGSAIAELFCKAGVPVLLTSRDPRKAESKARTLNRRFKQCSVTGVPNAEAIQQASVAILSTPFHGTGDWLLANKEAIVQNNNNLILVDISNPWRSGDGIEPTAELLSGVEQHRQILNHPATHFAQAFKNNFAMRQLQHASGERKIEFTADAAESRDRLQRLIQATTFKPSFRGLFSDGAAAKLEAEVIQCSCLFIFSFNEELRTRCGIE